MKAHLRASAMTSLQESCDFCSNYIYVYINAKYYPTRSQVSVEKVAKNRHFFPVLSFWKMKWQGSSPKTCMDIKSDKLKPGAIRVG